MTKNGSTYGLGLLAALALLPASGHAATDAAVEAQLKALAQQLQVVLAGFGGCGLKPAPFPTPDSELGTGPGLLSGPAGEFTLYRQ